VPDTVLTVAFVGHSAEKPHVANARKFHDETCPILQNFILLYSIFVQMFIIVTQFSFFDCLRVVHAVLLALEKT
jgi:hypothetical protein